MKRASPMPMGARNVVLDFSTASMSTVTVSMAVRNISMNRPWAIDVPFESVVTTSIAPGPGNMAETRAEATIPPAN